MPKVKISRDQVYPVYNISINPDFGVEIELNDDDFLKVKSVLEQYREVQDLLYLKVVEATVKENAG